MIKNRTTGKILANNKIVCNTIISKTVGLMFKKELIDCGYVFEFSRDVIGSIHMFFVFFPIDIIWLDKNLIVVELKENVKPFTPSLVPKKRCRYFIEIPSGTIKKSETKLGDRIVLEKLKKI